MVNGSFEDETKKCTISSSGVQSIVATCEIEKTTELCGRILSSTPQKHLGGEECSILSLKIASGLSKLSEIFNPGANIECRCCEIPSTRNEMRGLLSMSRGTQVKRVLRSDLHYIGARCNMQSSSRTQTKARLKIQTAESIEINRVLEDIFRIDMHGRVSSMEN